MNVFEREQGRGPKTGNEEGGFMQQPFVGVRQDDVCFCEEVGSPLLRVNMITPQEFRITTSKEVVAVTSATLEATLKLN